MGQPYNTSQFLFSITAGAETWIAVAYVLCMFAAAVFGRERIRSAGAYRISYILFALYLIVPIAINSALLLSQALDPVKPRPGIGPSPGSVVVSTGVTQLAIIVGRLLLAISIVLGLSSLRLHGATSAGPGNQPRV